MTTRSTPPAGPQPPPDGSLNYPKNEYIEAAINTFAALACSRRSTQ